jgi:long-subunit fatty acid transport protein
MKKRALTNLTKRLTFLFLMSLSFSISAQVTTSPKAKSDFWKKVQFGGGFGLGFGSGFTNISLAPSSIYNAYQYVSVGLGVQYSYLKQKNVFASNMYGGSIITLFNPIQEIQLSAELEQLRVNVDYKGLSSISNDFWNTGLFVGAGYRMENITIGARYNVLFDNDKGVYGDALMPFLRVLF